jgi:hypothetical protein
MISLKKIGILILALVFVTPFAKASGPDATLRVSGGSFALGIGMSWGSGTLTYKGKEYPVKAKGFSVGRVGGTGVSIHGEVYNLKHLQDFNGHYNYGGSGMRGVTVGGGKAGTIMTNQAGVMIRVSTTQKGVDVNATGGGVDMSLKK